jgi:8-oxo-dGTP pyrophosphatase MutT (NUDIX family)
LKTTEYLQFLKNKLQAPRPGLKAQLAMSPHPRPGNKTIAEVKDTHIKAGVLLLLYPRKNRLILVLTRRSDQVLHHQAQISLPGGKKEPDESLQETALRETREELGITLEQFEVLGKLTPLYVPPSNYGIYPFVAAIPARPEFNPFPKEVAEVIELPLEYLLDPKNVRREIWTIRGMDLDVPFFAYKNHKVWGATAMVLAEFKAILKD